MRIRFFAPSIILLASATLGLPACFSVGDDDAPSDDNDSCDTDAQCLNGQSCDNGRCVSNSGGNGGSSGSSSGGKGGSSGGSGGSTGGDGGASGGKGGSGGSTGGDGGASGGKGGTGGSTGGSGGTEGGSGGASGGTGGSTGGTGGSAGSTGETTPAKFCNRLTVGGEPVTLTLDVGDVSISAATGVCAPENECIGVPTGVDVAMALSDSSGVLSSGSYPEIPAGEEMVFFSVVGTDGSPSINGWPGNGICSGGDGTTGTVMKFCNQLASSGNSVTLTLDLNGVTVSAATGECMPIAACAPITGGVDVPIALLQGTEPIVTGTFPDVPDGASMMFVAEMDDLGEAPTVTGGPYEGICGGGAAARIVPVGGSQKSTDRSYIMENGRFSLAADELVMDAAVPGLARGRSGFTTR